MYCRCRVSWLTIPRFSSRVRIVAMVCCARLRDSFSASVISAAVAVPRSQRIRRMASWRSVRGCASPIGYGPGVMGCGSRWLWGYTTGVVSVGQVRLRLGNSQRRGRRGGAGRVFASSRLVVPGGKSERLLKRGDPALERLLVVLAGVVLPAVAGLVTLDQVG